MHVDYGNTGGVEENSQLRSVFFGSVAGIFEQHLPFCSET